MKIEIIVDQELIEQKLTDFNKIHYTKAHSLPMHQSQLYSKLDKDQIRGSILVGVISSEEYLNDNVIEFLKLLKITNSQILLSEY